MSPDEKIQSLEARLAAPKDDCEKIDAMNDLAYHLRSNDMARAEALSDEALSLASRLQHQRGIASSYSCLLYTSPSPRDS